MAKGKEQQEQLEHMFEAVCCMKGVDLVLH